MTITIVLANLMDKDGALNTETIARINEASRLDLLNPCDFLLLCGWAYRPDINLTIADAMYAFIRQAHPSLCPKTRCQRLSRDTVGDAVFSRLYIDNCCSLRGESITVVTSDYHVPRTKEVFSFIYGPEYSIAVYGASSFRHKAAIQTEENELNSLCAFRKTFENVAAGDLPSIYQSLTSHHPFYNGEVFPSVGSLSQVVSIMQQSGF